MESTSTSKPKSKRTMKQRRYLSHPQRTSHTSDEAAADNENVIPRAIRNRLHRLFEEVELEFETIYSEKNELQEKVDQLTERLDQLNVVMLAAGYSDEVTTATSGQLPDTPAAITRHQSIGGGSGGVLLAPKSKLTSLTSTEHDGVGRIPKFRNFESASSQISQRLKQSYKQSTNRIVSSFRNERINNHVVRQFKGHTDGVWEVNVYSRESDIIGSASLDKTARLWCANSGMCLLIYSGHQGSVNSIRFHPTMEVIMTAGGDRQCHLWKPEFERTLSMAAHRNLQEPLKYHSSGDDDVDLSDKEDIGSQQVVDSCFEQEVSHLTQPNTQLTGHTDVVIAADWLASGHQAITACWDRLARLYDVETGDLIDTLPGHEEELTNVVCHSTQRMALTSSRDNTFRLWDMRDTSLVVNVFQGHQKQVTTAVFNGPNRVISSSDDQFTKIWDLRNMSKSVCTITTNSPINRLSVSKQLNIIALPLDNKHVNLYNSNGIRIARLPNKKQQGHSAQVYGTAWQDNNMAHSCNLFSSSMDHCILGWRVDINNKD